MTDIVLPPGASLVSSPSAKPPPESDYVPPPEVKLPPGATLVSAAPSAGVVDSITDAAQSIPTGIAKFATGLGSLPRAIKDFSFPDNPYSNAPNPLAPLNKWPTFKQLWEDTGAKEAFHEPQTEAGKWTAAGSEGLLSLLSGNPAALALGTASGLGGEAASRLFGDSPWARAAGQMLTLLLGGPRAIAAPGASRVAKKMLTSTPDDVLNAAQARSRQASAEAGTTISPANFLPENNQLRDLRAAVAGDTGGVLTQAQILAEKEAMRRMEHSTIESIAPGVTPDASTTAAVDRTLTETPKLAEDAANAAALPRYNAAALEQLKPEDLDNVIQSVLGLQHRANATELGHPRYQAFEGQRSMFDKYLPQPANHSEADRLLAELSGEELPEFKPPEAPLPSWNTINAIGGEGERQGKSVLAGQTAKPSQNVAADVGGVLKDAAAAESTNIAGANIIGTTGRDWFNPPGLEEGSRSLSNPAVSPQDVTDISRAMSRTDARIGADQPTFPLMAKEKQLADSPSAVTGLGDWSRKTAGSLDSTFGQQRIRDNYLETMKQSYIQGGASEAAATEAAQGAAQLHDIIQSVADSHTKLPMGVSLAKVLAEASSGMMSKVLRFLTPSFEMVRTWTAANSLDKMHFAKTMANLDRAMASPDMVDDLRRFAQWDWRKRLLKSGARAGVATAVGQETNN